MLPTSLVHRTEVDGVPVLWVPSDARTVRASLCFRVGMADERLIDHGWVHLIEHLALHGLTGSRRSINGSVGVLLTTFDVAGEAEQVVAFLRELCAWLSAPHFDEVEHEARVLEAESRQRSVGTAARHLLQRYGARGPGVAGWDELGLRRVDTKTLRALVRQKFNSGNAMLALSHPPPPNLRLALPDGRKSPAAVAVPCESDLPGVFTEPIDGIAISGTVPRSTAGTMLVETLRNALRTYVRDRSGSGYSAWGHYEVVDERTAVLVAGIDVLREARSGLVSDTVGMVKAVAASGGDAVELADHVAMGLRQLADDREGSWQPWSCVRSELLSGKAFDVAGYVEEIATVSVEQVAKAANFFAETLIVGVDQGTALGDLRPLLPPVTPTVADGRVFRHVDAPITESSLVLGPSQLSVHTDRGYVTSRFDALHAVMAYPDGARRLIDDAGYGITVEPTLWQSGSEVVQSLDQALDQRLYVSMPARATADIPSARINPRQRRRHWMFRHRTTLDGLLMLILAVLAIFGAFIAQSPAPAYLAFLIYLAFKHAFYRWLGQPSFLSRRRQQK